MENEYKCYTCINARFTENCTVCNKNQNPEYKKKIDTLKIWIDELHNALNPKPIIDNTVINAGLL